MVTRAENIAKWVYNMSYERIPKNIIEVGKQQLLGMLGACFAGSTTTGGRAILETIKNYDCKPEVTIFPSGMKSSVLNALYTNCAFAMGLDYDDYLLTTHTGTSAYSVPLALGEKLDISGKEYLTCLIIGNEIMGRVGLAIYPPGEGQMQSFIHLAGGAVMAGRLLGLSEEQITNALGIAFYQAPLTIPVGFFGPLSKFLTAAIPAKIGVESAYLAKHGFTGAKTIFEDPQGFCKYFSEANFENVLDSDLGEAWVSLTLSEKIYPGCAYVDAIADAIFKILDKVKKAGKTLDYHEVEAIKVSNSLLSAMMDDMSRPFTNIEEVARVQSPVALNFYQPYNVAVILIDQKLTPEQFTVERITDPEVHALAQKVEIAPDIGFSAKSAQIVPFKDIPKPGFHLGQWDFRQWKMYCGCKVAIKMRNGDSWTAKVEIPIGAAGGEPYSMEKKFIQEGTYVGLSEAQLQDAIGIINELENHKVRELISCLVVN